MTTGSALLLGALAAAIVLGNLSALAQSPAVPRATIQAGMKKAKCDVPIADAVSDAEPADLGSGLKLIEVYCWRAAYNFGSIFFAYRAADPSKARLLSFQVPGKNGKLAPALSLSGPDFEAAAGVMRSFHKGRGVGDCGDIGEWRWNGKDFVLRIFWRKADCDGEPFEAEGSDDAPDKWRVYPPRTQR